MLWIDISSRRNGGFRRPPADPVTDECRSHLMAAIRERRGPDVVEPGKDPSGTSGIHPVGSYAPTPCGPSRSKLPPTTVRGVRRRCPLKEMDRSEAGSE